MLLSEITMFFPKISADFVLDYWTVSASQLKGKCHLSFYQIKQENAKLLLGSLKLFSILNIIDIMFWYG